MIIPKPGHSYQLIPLGLDGTTDPITVKVTHIKLGGSVAYAWSCSERSGGAYANLSSFVLMIDREVGAKAKKKAPKSEVEHAFPASFSPKLRAAFRGWIADRVERKIKGARYTTRGWASLMKTWGKVPEAKAIAAIENSIANGYVGLFEPKTNGFTPPPSTTTKMEVPAEIKANLKREQERS